MCVYLLLGYIRLLNLIRPSLQQMLQRLQLNLFERRDLLELLRGHPPEPPLADSEGRGKLPRHPVSPARGRGR